MAPDLSSLIDPSHTALVTQECQEGVIGESSPLPALARAARTGMIPNIAAMLAAARAAGIPVVHCLALRRADGRGANRNARLFMALRATEAPLVPGSPQAGLVKGIEADESDFVLSRYHGLGPMAGTDLDPVLRNLGVRTIVGVGVSVNVGITNFVMDAVNHGYQFVLPRDAVVGVPNEYAEAVIEHTLSLLATVTTTGAVLDAWRTRRLE
jgi:nicotinamidase-related amidase